MTRLEAEPRVEAMRIGPPLVRRELHENASALTCLLDRPLHQFAAKSRTTVVCSNADRFAGRYPTVDTSVMAPVAESLIRAALGEWAVVEVSGWAKTRCQLFVVGEIAEELGLYRDEIDAIIAGAEGGAGTSKPPHGTG
jgi:hypothetical protein